MTALDLDFVSDRHRHECHELLRPHDCLLMLSSSLDYSCSFLKTPAASARAFSGTPPHTTAICSSYRSFSSRLPFNSSSSEPLPVSLEPTSLRASRVSDSDLLLLFEPRSSSCFFFLPEPFVLIAHCVRPSLLHFLFFHSLFTSSDLARGRCEPNCPPVSASFVDVDALLSSNFNVPPGADCSSSATAKPSAPTALVSGTFCHGSRQPNLRMVGRRGRWFKTPRCFFEFSKFQPWNIINESGPIYRVCPWIGYYHFAFTFRHGAVTCS